MKVAVVIPARYKSGRFPGKPLKEILGIPMVIRVAQLAEKAIDKENIYIATEDISIKTKVEEYGFKVIMTSPDHPCCTDRVAEASTQIDADIIVNLQGDEPMIDPNEIKLAIQEKLQYPEFVINCMADLKDFEKPEDRNIIKMAVGLNNNLVCASRNPIPVTKSGITPICKKQVCIYVYNKKELEIFTKQKTTPLEEVEEVDILRFLEMGIPVRIIEVPGDSHAVDVPGDIDIVEKLLRDGKN
jgi:3-deoxy-manno-octulosonate cytidylyltransferase (CMP-KDO synthetase)